MHRNREREIFDYVGPEVPCVEKEFFSFDKSLLSCLAKEKESPFLI